MPSCAARLGLAMGLLMNTCNPVVLLSQRSTEAEQDDAVK